MVDLEPVLKELYIMLESLRNGFAFSHEHAQPWLVSVARFDEAGFDPDLVSEFWQALGVEADMIELFAAINPRWTGEALYISRKRANGDNLMEKVAGVLLYLLRFRKFTASRWTTIGSGCRSLAVVLSIGLEASVDFVRRRPGVSSFHLGGFRRLTSEVKLVVAVGALSGHVPDAVLAVPLEDDRVLRQAWSHKHVMSEEIDRLIGLSLQFFRRLGQGPGISSSAIRSDTLRSAFVAAAYVEPLGGWSSATAMPTWRTCSPTMRFRSRPPARSRLSWRRASTARPLWQAWG